jgi:hypothetical protein
LKSESLSPMGGARLSHSGFVNKKNSPLSNPILKMLIIRNFLAEKKLQNKSRKQMNLKK